MWSGEALGSSLGLSQGHTAFRPIAPHWQSEKVIKVTGQWWGAPPKHRLAGSTRFPTELVKLRIFLFPPFPCPKFTRLAWIPPWLSIIAYSVETMSSLFGLPVRRNQLTMSSGGRCLPVGFRLQTTTRPERDIKTWHFSTP